MIRLRECSRECDDCEGSGCGRESAAATWLQPAEYDDCEECSGSGRVDCDSATCDCTVICEREGCWSNKVAWLVDRYSPRAKCLECGHVWTLAAEEYAAARGWRATLRANTDPHAGARLAKLAGGAR